MVEKTEKTAKNVVILGCGWLGQIVGKEFAQIGDTVFGSFRSADTEKALISKGIEGFHIDFNESTELPASITREATHVFVFIPPSAAKSMSYEQLLNSLLSQFSPSVKVIFSSSTGVYPKDAGIYDEQFKINPNKPNRLFPAEVTLRNILGNQLTIFRLGGLIGPERHPAYSLSGKKLSNDGSNPVNLIHAKDIVSAVRWVCEHDHFGCIYNLVHPNHPAKNEYYTAAALHFGIDPPEFGSEPATNRLVSGNFIEERTSFKYRHALDNFDDFLR